jgi:predicted ATPase
MIKRVKITGYKSLKAIEIELQPLTVFLGPNAAGKRAGKDKIEVLTEIWQSGCPINTYMKIRYFRRSGRGQCGGECITSHPPPP